MFAVPLAQMTRDDKLRALEALWEDLTRHGEFDSPEWHGPALLDTEQALKEGKAEFLDWETAKQHLRNRKP